MKEAFEKMIERLEARKRDYHIQYVTDYIGYSTYHNYKHELNEVIEIVKQVAEEYNNESVNCDLINRSALLKTLNEYVLNAYDCGGIDDENVIEYQQTHNDKSNYIIQGFSEVYELLQDVPTVYNNGWIPFTERAADPEEREAYGCDMILSCPLPEEDEEILVTYKNGYVGLDTFLRDGYELYLDSGAAFITEAIAWKPKPAGYCQEGELNQ